MGLDQYLLATKGTRKEINTETTGCCGGIFPMLINSNGKEEIGYWRKCYEANDYILQTIDTGDKIDVNCEELEVTKEEAEQILMHAYDVINKCNLLYPIHAANNNEEIRVKRQDIIYEWGRTIRAFERALDLMNQYDAEIYYKIWF